MDDLTEEIAGSAPDGGAADAPATADGAATTADPGDAATGVAADGAVMTGADATTAETLAAATPREMGTGERILDLIDLGGPVVMILIAMSVFALTIVLLKFWQFWSLGVERRRNAQRALVLIEDGQVAEAHQLAARTRNPVAQVIARALEGLNKPGADVARVREDATRLGGDLLEDMRSYLRPLEVIAALSPLLGLFGTVLGMIDAFRALEMAGNNVNPATLSGGIWVALLTTAVGLGVAIPVVMLVNWLERKVERVAHEMDSALSRIFSQSHISGVSENRHDGSARIRTAAAGE